MVTLIVVSFLFVLVASALIIGLMMAWALSGSSSEEDVAKQTNPRGLKSRLRRFWSWANAVPPKLEYRRDKKGRFRKLKRW